MFFPQVNYSVESLICRIRAKWIRRWDRLIKVFSLSLSNYTSHFLTRHTLLSVTAFKHHLLCLAVPSKSEWSLLCDKKNEMKYISHACTLTKDRHTHIGTRWSKVLSIEMFYRSISAVYNQPLMQHNHAPHIISTSGSHIYIGLIFYNPSLIFQRLLTWTSHVIRNSDKQATTCLYCTI